VLSLPRFSSMRLLMVSKGYHPRQDLSYSPTFNGSVPLHYAREGTLYITSSQTDFQSQLSTSPSTVFCITSASLLRQLCFMKAMCINKRCH
jgi:hypothetical protein